jgi:uncharacterized membrane protein
MATLDELRAEIAQLRIQVAQFESKLDALANEAPAQRPSAAPVSPAFTPPVAPPMVRQAVPAPVGPKRTPVDMEAVIGGNWLNRIGAATLVVGMAFFLKYAIDNGWINPTGRVIIGLLVGLGCLALGERHQKNMLPVFAQGLSGAGVAILYFTTFAAYSFYTPRLIDQVPAFVFMAVVTAVAIALSVRYDTVVIAALGILGGFLTPILLSGARAGAGGRLGDDIGVLVYIGILDLGILGITRFKNWRWLNIVSMVGTVVLFSGIVYSWYGQLALSIGFATLFFLIFAAQAYVQNVMTRRALSAVDFFLAIAPPVLYFAHCYFVLQGGRYAVAVGPFAVVMAAVYVAFSNKVFKTAFEDKKLCMMYLTMAAAFLTVAIPIQLRGYWVVWGWGVEALLLSILGFQFGSAKTRTVAVGVFALAAIDLFGLTSSTLSYYRPTAYPAILLPTYLVLTALIACVIYLYHSNREALTHDERILAPDSLIVGAAAILLVGLSASLHIWADAQMWRLGTSVLLTLLWLVYGLAAIILGIQYKHRPIRLFALVLLGLVLLKTYLSDVWAVELAWRIVAFIALGVMLLAASYFYQKYRPQVAHLVAGEGDHNEEK